MREGGTRTKADEKRCGLFLLWWSLPESSIFPVFIFPKRGTCVSRRLHQTISVHYYFSSAPILPPPSKVAVFARGSFPLSPPSSFLRSSPSTLLLPLSPWKPCGSYATFGPGAWLARGMSTVENVKEERRAGSGGEDTVPERDLDAIFKSGATSILSVSLFLSFCPLSHPLSRRLRSTSFEPEDAGYRNTALNRPHGLTLTRDHPLVRRGLPCRFLNFVSSRASTYGEFRLELVSEPARARGIRVCLRSFYRS